MKRLVFLIALLIGPAMLTGLISCGECSPTPYKYKIGGYKLSLMKGQIATSVASPLRDNDTIVYRNLEIDLVGEPIHVATRQVGGGSSLWACSQVQSPLDKVATITITSDQPYSVELPAGANLAAVMGVGPINYTPQPLSDYLIAHSDAVEHLSLSLLKAPSQLVRHRFTFVVELANGNRYTAISAPVFVKP